MKGNEFLRRFMYNNLNNLNCCVVGNIIKIDKNISKCDIQPLHKINIEDQLQKMPILVDVPLFNLMTEDFLIRLPVQKNDFVLVVFADYDIQNLVLTGKLKETNTDDIHALNDAIAIPFALNPFNKKLIDESKEKYLEDLIISKRDLSQRIVLKNDGSIEIESAKDKDININTKGTGEVNIDCWDYHVNTRKPR